MERLRNPYSGLGQYCLQLGKALAALPDAGVQFEYLMPPQSGFDFGSGVQARALSKKDRWLGFRTNADLWHCTHQDSAFWPRDRHIPVVMTIHDLNFLEREDYSPAKKRFKRWQLQRRVNRCKGLVYISRFTRQWVNQQLHIAPGIQQCVIYNGNNLSGEAGIPRPEWAAWNPFLFSIGIHPKKNYAATLPLLAKLSEYQWVIAGTDSKGYRQSLEKQAAALGIDGQLLFTGPVSEPEKQWLYEHCAALLFPSLSEGFGLPVVEAMAVGKPVFLSKLTSLPEVGGPEAFYFDDFSVETQYITFKKGMEAYQNDPEKPNRLQAWAAQFDWNRTAMEYLNFYAKVTQSIPVTG